VRLPIGIGIERRKVFTEINRPSTVKSAIDAQISNRRSNQQSTLKSAIDTQISNRHVNSAIATELGTRQFVDRQSPIDNPIGTWQSAFGNQ
jgi:hypothetical protein